MSVIKINCVDQVMQFTNTPVIAAGGVRENSLEFTFCSKWDGFEKVAVFLKNAEMQPPELIGADGRCEIPYDVLAAAGRFYIGVFGINADGVRKTTEYLEYKLVDGAVASVGDPEDPSIFEQMLQLASSKQSTLVWDSEPKQGSHNAVDSDAVYRALKGLTETASHLKLGTRLTDSTNIDELLTPGVYYVLGSGAQGLPRGDGFTIIEVREQDDSHILQTQYIGTTGEIFMRVWDKLNKKWSAWQSTSILRRGLRLVNGDNMDDVKTPGVYHTTGANTITNLPYQAGSSVILVHEGGYTGHIVQRQIGTANASCPEYVRRWTGTTWSDWTITAKSVNGETANNTDGGIELNHSHFELSEKTVGLAGDMCKSSSATLRRQYFTDLCAFKFYFETATAMTAGTEYDVYTFSTAFAPSTRHALACAGSKRGSAIVTQDGVVKFRPAEDIGTGYSVYITGVWFMS